MTRYVDREPRKGDHVLVTVEGVLGDDLGGFTIEVPGATLYLATSDVKEIRAIAPEPKVGDVVTADMALPEGSIIEPSRGSGVGKLAEGNWYIAGQRGPQNTIVNDNWRIVRIGGGQ